MKKVAFICPYPFGVAPSQRFRHEHYLPYLVDYKIEYKLFPFLNDKSWNILYEDGKLINKVYYVLIGLVKRVLLLFQLRKYDFVYIHREATPLGFPFFEWICAKVLRKKIVYSFDDAIFLWDDSRKNSLIKFLKNPNKVRKIASWSHKVCTGNDYLFEWAKNYNNNVVVIPTVVDTNNRHNTVKNQKEGKLTIGWTGTHSTLTYLDNIIPILKELREQIEFRLLVIANKNPEYDVDGFEFIKWSEENEIADLLEIHVGVMPLRDTEWAKGKCGFKAIQYMALGIPAVVSNVGVNSQIVEQDVNGYVINSSNEWIDYLKKLLEDDDLRSEMGLKARKKIISKYSIESTLQAFLHLFN